MVEILCLNTINNYLILHIISYI